MASDETTAKRAARDNAKIEQLADAIENMALGLASKMRSDAPSPQIEQFVKDARVELRTALGVFMAPNLRLVENPRQPYEADVPETNRVKCASCKKNIACKPDCFFWHKALKDSIDPGVELPPPEPRTPRPPRAA